jgi:hypothetical protein
VYSLGPEVPQQALASRCDFLVSHKRLMCHKGTGPGTGNASLAPAIGWQPIINDSILNADGMADSVPVMTSVSISLQQIDTGVLPQCLYETPYMHDILARLPTCVEPVDQSRVTQNSFSGRCTRALGFFKKCWVKNIVSACQLGCFLTQHLRC